jgi:hypothetical protein
LVAIRTVAIPTALLTLTLRMMASRITTIVGSRAPYAELLASRPMLIVTVAVGTASYLIAITLIDRATLCLGRALLTDLRQIRRVA